MTATGTAATIGSPSCARRTRHFQVEQHDAGHVGGTVADGAQQVQGLEAVFRGDGVEPFRREKGGEHLTGITIVFDDQDIGGCGHQVQLAIKSRTASAVEDQRALQARPVQTPSGCDTAPVGHPDAITLSLNHPSIIDHRYSDHR
jgi:hypothetical protein